MKSITCYDDTEDVIATLCEDLDWTEPEVIDALIDIAMEATDNDISDVLHQHYE